MSSSLFPTIEDDLLSTVDDIRGSVHAFVGDRQHVVKIVRRVWTGPGRGQGAADLQEIVVTPIPRVQFEVASPVDYQLRPEGRSEEGNVTVSEISLAGYQEDDLTGGNVPSNVEFYWVLEDNLGQGIRRRAYEVAAPPIADREKTIGWIVKLRRALGGK